jgi:serine acetyltransferase
MIGAGSVVTKDVPGYALVVGNPAKQIGWVGQAGQVLLELGNGRFKCPATGSEFELSNRGLTQID